MMEKFRTLADKFKNSKFNGNLIEKKGGFISQFLAVIALAVVVLLIIVAIKQISFSTTASEIQNGYDSAIQKANNTMSSVS
jgi:hypothetical protein